MLASSIYEPCGWQLDLGVINRASVGDAIHFRIQDSNRSRERLDHLSSRASLSRLKALADYTSNEEDFGDFSIQYFQDRDVFKIRFVESLNGKPEKDMAIADADRFCDLIAQIEKDFEESPEHDLN